MVRRHEDDVRGKEADKGIRESGQVFFHVKSLDSKAFLKLFCAITEKFKKNEKRANTIHTRRLTAP